MEGGKAAWTAIHNAGRKFENLRESACRSSTGVRPRKAGLSTDPVD